LDEGLGCRPPDFEEWGNSPTESFLSRDGVGRGTHPLPPLFEGKRGGVDGELTLCKFLSKDGVGRGTHPLPPLFEGKRGGWTRGLVYKKNADTTPCRRSISE